MTCLTLTDSPRERRFVRMPGGYSLDARVAIYHHAARSRSDYTPEGFTHALLSSDVMRRPQLVAINGRPC